MKYQSNSKVSWEDYMGREIDIVRAARVSTGKDLDDVSQKEQRGLIRFLYRNRHFSPFESCVLKFRIETPIFVAREFMRHRTFSYSELSGRYTELDLGYYMPAEDRLLAQIGKTGDYEFIPGTDEQGEYTRHYIQLATDTAHHAYMQMLSAGISKEVARMVLPVNTYTAFYATGNLRNWLQFLDLRLERYNSKPQYEIRRVAEQIEDYIKRGYPLTHEIWKEQDQ